MSKENPGVIFDASNSWNGYNHQGKLAILFAVKKILEVYDNNLSFDDNKRILEEYFLEIEHIEDFSIGKKNSGGQKEYYYVHQVKNHAERLASNYDSAFMGLAYHVSDKSSIKKAYLHTTKEVDFKGKSIAEYIKQLISNPVELNIILTRINSVRKNTKEKEKLYAKKRGRSEDFITKLKIALKEEDDSQKVLNENNIDKALNALEKKTQKQINDIKSLTDEQISKIDIYKYDISKRKQSFCNVDQIKDLIKDEIKRSIKCLSLNQSWLNDNFVEHRYLFLLGKLDEHIIDRNLNYPLYKNDKKDREIKLAVILDWLMNDDIDTADDDFYKFKLKEVFTYYSNKFCDKCKEKTCDSCLMVSAINKIGKMTFDQMNEFIVLTNPSNNEGLSVSTFSEYFCRDNLADPFFRGIKEINIPFEDNKQAITYIDKTTAQYILTTLVLNENYDDNATICSNIYKNKALYELFMDYDCFISKNINCGSILDEVLKLGKNICTDERSKDHIAHLKDISIITLDDFKNKI